MTLCPPGRISPLCPRHARTLARDGRSRRPRDGIGSPPTVAPFEPRRRARRHAGTSASSGFFGGDGRRERQRRRARRPRADRRTRPSSSSVPGRRRRRLASPSRAVAGPAARPRPLLYRAIRTTASSAPTPIAIVGARSATPSESATVLQRHRVGDPSEHGPLRVVVDNWCTRHADPRLDVRRLRRSRRARRPGRGPRRGRLRRRPSRFGPGSPEHAADRRRSPVRTTVEQRPDRRRSSRPAPTRTAA